MGLGQHALAAVIALAAGFGAMVAFPQARVGLRALLALVRRDVGPSEDALLEGVSP